MCSVARDGRTMPSASSTVTVVWSPRWGDHWYGGQRPLMGNSTFVFILMELSRLLALFGAEKF